MMSSTILEQNVDVGNFIYIQKIQTVKTEHILLTSMEKVDIIVIIFHY